MRCLKLPACFLSNLSTTHAPVLLVFDLVLQQGGLCVVLEALVGGSQFHGVDVPRLLCARMKVGQSTMSAIAVVLSALTRDYIGPLNK